MSSDAPHIKAHREATHKTQADIAKIVSEITMLPAVSSVNFGLCGQPSAAKNAIDFGRSFTGKFTKMLLAMASLLVVIVHPVTPIGRCSRRDADKAAKVF